MAGDTFMVGLRLVAQQFSMRIVGGSNDDASWPGSIRGAENVVSEIVGLGGRRSFDSQRGFREHSEEFRQAWLHLADVAAEILYDLIRRFRYVFRIAIERGTKAAQAFVARFESKIGEQTASSFDLSKPERVNLRRRHICGGLLSNCLLVPSSTVRQAVQSDCGPAARSVVLCDEIREMVIRGEHLRIDCLLDLFRQALLVLGRDGSGKLLRRGQERIFGNSSFALSWYLLEQNPDRHQSVFFSLAQYFDCLLESTGDLVETGNVIFVMLHGIKRYGVRKIGKTVVDALHLRDGHLIILQRVVRNAIIQNVKQEIVGEAILL